MSNHESRGKPKLELLRTHLVADPAPPEVPSSRSPVREAREAAWQAARRAPPAQRAAQSPASESQAQAAQRSGTVGLAGAWVKSPPPSYRVPGRHRGNPLAYAQWWWPALNDLSAMEFSA